MSDKCKNVIAIPQSYDVGSCWFNTLLMSLLYSQNSRKLLLNDNYLATRPASDKTSKILNQLLRKNYINHENSYDYFKYMRPEKILKYLNIIQDENFYKEKLKHGYDPRMFIHHFIKKIGKSSIHIDLYNNQLYGNFNLIYGHLEYQGRFLNADKLYNLRRADFRTDPDYIIVNPLQPQENDGEYEKMFYTSIRFNPGLNILDRLNLDNIGIRTDGIISLEDKITYDGETYILDSYILGNYNGRTAGGHVITGITCNNNRYVYNGWLRDVRDDIKQGLNPKILPCELMKYKWNPNDPNSFCLNIKTCKLDAVRDPIKDLCFSFNSGLRCLIYVRQDRIIDKGYKYDENYSSPSELILPSKVSSKDRVEFDKFKLKLKRDKEIKEAERIKEELRKVEIKKEEKKKEQKKIVQDLRKQMLKKLKNQKEKKKEPKLIINMKSVIKKIKDPYLNLMYYNKSYYLIEYCEHNIIKLLLLRNPKYIIIQTNNNYDTTSLIDRIPKIEYLTKLNNYGLYIKKSLSAENQIIYDDYYNYELIAYSRNGIYVYKNIDKTKSPVKITPKLLIKKEFREDKIKIEDPKKLKCARRIIDDDYLLPPLRPKIKSPPRIISSSSKSSSKSKSLKKEDYIERIKKIYPYYDDQDLNKLTIEKLKKIYYLNCSDINLNYDKYSCYMDSLLVALFNSRNPIIKNTILNSPLHNYNNSELTRYGQEIRDELKKLYNKIVKPSSSGSNNKCTMLRSLLKKYYDKYKDEINPKFRNVEWTSEQNDFSELLLMLSVIFDIPHDVKYSINGKDQMRIFFDINNDIDILSPGNVNIKDYYPKYKKIMDLDGTGKIREETIEYRSAPFLFIQINRILEGIAKILKPIIPEIKIKLKKNNLYLNSIIIHQGDDINSGHYITLFECKGYWYEYNDMIGKSKKIGTFNDILKNDYYKNNMVGLLYISLPQ